MISLEALRRQAIAKCEERIQNGEKRVIPATLPRMKERWGI